MPARPFDAHGTFAGLRPIADALAAVGLALLSGCTTTPKADRLPMEAAGAALTSLSQRTGMERSTLTVAAATKARYVNLGQEVFAFKILDAKGEIHGISLGNDLRVVDTEKLASDDRALQRNRLGALDPALVARLRSGNSERVAVVVWVAAVASDRADRPTARGERLDARQIDESYAAADASRKRALSTPVQAVLQRLRKFDREARAEPLSPAISAKLAPDALRELANAPDIERIYLDVPMQPELQVAKATTGIQQIQSTGTLGGGIRVAVIEPGGGRVESASLLLRPVVQDNQNVCPSVSDHLTSVAGILIERRFNFLGIDAGEDGAAPNVELRAGGACSNDADELRSASTRAADWGARVINLSFGKDTGLIPGASDRFFDDMTFNRWRTVVKSAGNRACPNLFVIDSDVGGEGNVTSPGLAYNVITVGGFNDKNTVDWGDDSVYECSSFRDPVSTHGDRQKPEIAAPAVGITLVTSGPANLVDRDGTSGAAPFVAAAAALLIERNSRLAIWPEILRATLMATATHNIEGASRFSDVDGAGGLVANDAANLIGDTRRWDGLRYDCGGSTPNTLDLATLSVGPRTRHRVVLSWDTDPSYSDYLNRPSADIDLKVVNSLGATVATSQSFDNTFEVVEFDSWFAGTYTIQAVKFRCDLPSWLGWAWNTFPMRVP